MLAHRKQHAQHAVEHRALRERRARVRARVPRPPRKADRSGLPKALRARRAAARRAALHGELQDGGVRRLRAREHQPLALRDAVAGRLTRRARQSVDDAEAHLPPVVPPREVEGHGVLQAVVQRGAREGAHRARARRAGARRALFLRAGNAHELEEREVGEEIRVRLVVCEYPVHGARRGLDAHRADGAPVERGVAVEAAHVHFASAHVGQVFVAVREPPVASRRRRLDVAVLRGAGAGGSRGAGAVPRVLRVQNRREGHVAQAEVPRGRERLFLGLTRRRRRAFAAAAAAAVDRAQVPETRLERG